MSVDQREIDCYEYINIIKDLESLPKGLYGVDNIRTAFHDKLCQEFNLTKEQTKKYTDNLDKLKYNGTDLYFALLNESKLIKSIEEK